MGNIANSDSWYKKHLGNETGRSFLSGLESNVFTLAQFSNNNAISYAGVIGSQAHVTYTTVSQALSDHGILARGINSITNEIDYFSNGGINSEIEGTKEMAREIVESATKSMVSYVKDKTLKVTKQLTSDMMTDLSYYTSYYYKQKFDELSYEYLKDVVTYSDTKNSAEEEEKNKKKKFVDQLGEFSYFTVKLNSAITDVQTEASKVISYIENYRGMGKDWINEQVNTALTSAKTSVGEYIDTNSYTLQKERRKVAESAGKSIGELTAKSHINTLKRKQKEKIDKARMLTAQKVNEAKAKVNSAILSLMGKIGLKAVNMLTTLTH